MCSECDEQASRILRERRVFCTWKKCCSKAVSGRPILIKLKYTTERGRDFRERGPTCKRPDFCDSVERFSRTALSFLWDFFGGSASSSQSLSEFQFPKIFAGSAQTPLRISPRPIGPDPSQIIPRSFLDSSPLPPQPLSDLSRTFPGVSYVYVDSSASLSDFLREPRTPSPGRRLPKPRAASPEPRAGPLRAESRAPSPDPWAPNREPRALSPEPRALSPEPRAPRPSTATRAPQPEP